MQLYVIYRQSENGLKFKIKKVRQNGIFSLIVEYLNTSVLANQCTTVILFD